MNVGVSQKLRPDDAQKVATLLGDRGHIALEVHDGDENRWKTGAVCRWRNTFIREL